MLNNKKVFLVSGFLMLLSVLPACSTIDYLLGRERTLPEDSKTTFGTPHTPILNPGGAGGNDGRPTSDASSSSTRHVPIENNSASTSDIAPVAVVQAPVQAPTATVAPVIPVTSNEASSHAYPSLATVPSTPVRPDQSKTTAALNAMQQEHELSEAQRQDLMNNQNATVMTSPQTGQMVDNAAMADAIPPLPPAPTHIYAAPTDATPPVPVVKQQASNSTQGDGGFNSWLHNLLPSDNKPPKQAPAQNTASATVADASAVPAMAYSAPSVAPTPAPTPRPVASEVPPAAPTPAPLVATPATPPPAPLPAVAPVTTQANVEPVHLHPPTMSDETITPTTADATQATDGSSSQSAITLTEPTNPQVRYLNDSRYAARREHQNTDDLSD